MAVLWALAPTLPPLTQHDDPATASLIHGHKHAMLCDMVGLVRHRVWRAPGRGGARGGGGQQGAGAAAGSAGHEAQGASGFVQLDTGGGG